MLLLSKVYHSATVQITGLPTVVMYFALACLFLAFPFFGFLGYSLLLYVLDVRAVFVKLYLVISTLFISAIASLRAPTKDLAHYLSAFHEFGQYGFNDFFESIYKDQLFFYVNKLIYEVGLSSDGLFTFFWAFIFYALIFRSLYLLFSHRFLTKQQLLIVCMFSIFSVEYLEFSTHLIRQFVASALLVWVVSCFIIGRRSLLSLVSAGFVHFSTFSFVLLYPILRKKISVRQGILLVGLATLLVGIDLQVLNLIPDIGLSNLNLIISRVLGAADVGIDNGEVSIKMHAITCFFLVLIGFFIYVRDKSNYVLLFNYMLLSYVIVLITSEIPLITLRFSFYQYPFYIIGFAIFVKEIFVDVWLRAALFLIFFAYSARFFLYFENNYWWSVEFYEQILTKNILFLFGII